MNKLILAALIFCSPLLAEEVFLTCQVTQIAASKSSTKSDRSLKKIVKALEKDSAFQEYKGFRSVGKKNLSATKHKEGKAQLKNKTRFAMKVISVVRAHRKNTIKLDVSLGDHRETKSFIDRNYLLLNAGELSSKEDLILAVSCPLFP